MVMNSLTAMPIDQLKRAIEIREQIDALKLELNELTGMSPLISTHGTRSGKQNGFNQPGRTRMAATQDLRWSRYSAAPANSHMSSAKKPRLSPAGRAKVSAAVKARWERYRAAKARAAK